MDVDYLREALRQDAQLVGDPDPNLYEQVRTRRQKSDRRRLTIVAASLAALLVGIGVPISLNALEASQNRVAGPPIAPVADIFGVPTRGSLGSDTEFLEGVRQLTWDVPGIRVGAGELQVPNAPIESRHVVFAGDVVSGRWSLVVGDNTVRPTDAGADPELQTDLGALSDNAGVWFVGPPGADSDEMEMVGVPRPMRPEVPVSLYDGPTGAIVAVAAPGDVIEISPRPDVAADASVTRNHVDAGATDGVAVTTLDPNPYDFLGGPAVQFRVTRVGVVVAEQGPDVYGDPDATRITPEIMLQYLRSPVYALPGDDAVRNEQQVAAQILGEYGLRPDQVDLHVHYVGPVPSRTGAPGGLTVLTTTFPSGAVLTRAVWAEQFLSFPTNPVAIAGTGGAWCANELTAAGVPAEQRSIAIRCDVGAGVGDGQLPEPVSTLVVIAPAHLADIVAMVESTAGSTTLTLVDGGIGMAEFPEGAETVVIQSPDGTVSDEVPIYTS